MRKRTIQQLSFLVCGAAVSASRVWAQDLRDIRPPEPYPRPWLWLGIAFAVVAVIVGLWAWRRRRRSARKTEVVIVPLPWETARERLQSLKEENYVGRGLVKEYYSELSDIVRHYLEDRYAVRAPDMTTEEFLQHVRTSGILAGRQTNILKDFLRSCDLVKFAKYGPSLDETEQSYDIACRLIDETCQPDSEAVSGQSG